MAILTARRFRHRWVAAAALALFAARAPAPAFASIVNPTHRIPKAPAAREPATPRGRAEIIFWHNQDGAQATYLDQLVKEFNRSLPANAPRIRAETGFDLEAALIELDHAYPEAVLLPSDLLGLHARLRFSEIASLDGEIESSAREAVTIGGKLYGMPILDGNHLLLLYNRRLVPEPATSWEMLRAQAPILLRQGVQPLALPLASAYFFLPFLDLFGAWPITRGQLTLDSPGTGLALAFQRALVRDRLVPAGCDEECPNARFYRREFAYAINGEWALERARVALGGDLGVAMLPSFGGRPMRSVRSAHVLAFPNGSLDGTHGPILRKFSAFLLSREAQARWSHQLHRISVRSDVRAECAASDPLLQASLHQLARSRPVPEDRRMAHVWQSIGRGLRLGAVPASELPKRMQIDAIALSVEPSAAAPKPRGGTRP